MAALAGIVMLGIPSLALAGNGLHPRTEVDWSQLEIPCLDVIDRSVDPVWHLEYAIPFEDTEVTPDEVDNSRTHQFFAFCRQKSSQEHFPNWITDADVAAADAKDLIDAMSVDPQDIFEHNTEWEGCWFRINADEDRRPITFPMAEEGVDWDTTGLGTGTYVIYSYTYEPVYNVWTKRPGVVKVTDGGDPKDVGPGASVTTTELILYKDQIGVIEGCVDAHAGTLATAYYAITDEESETDGADSPWAANWVPFVEDQPVEGSTFAVEFQPPEEVAGTSVVIRVDFEDPDGKAYTAHMLELVTVLGTTDPNGGCDETGGSFIGQGCAEDSGGTTGSGTAGGDTTGTGTTPTSGDGGSDETVGVDDSADGGGSPKGCGCTSSGGRERAWLLVPLAGLLLRTRRRATARRPL